MIDFIVSIDKEILYFIQEFLRCDFLNKIFSFITSLGNGGFIWIVISIILLIPKKTRKAGVLSICSLLLCYVTNDLIIKKLVARERPFNKFSELIPLIKKPADFSFPSGHSASSFASAGILFRYLDKKYGILAIVLAALIAFSRLYLGVHFPSDVIAGIIMGLLSSYTISKLEKYIFLKRKYKIEN